MSGTFPGSGFQLAGVAGVVKVHQEYDILQQLFVNSFAQEVLRPSDTCPAGNMQQDNVLVVEP